MLYLVAIWNISWLVGTFFPVLVCCTKKNLATLAFLNARKVHFAKGQIKSVDAFHISGYQAGLPDGLFSNQKSQFGYILEGLGIENVIIFCDHLDYFMAIRYNLWQFGTACGHLVYFSHFGMFGPRKIWQPLGRRPKWNFFSNLAIKTDFYKTCQNGNQNTKWP
jgi:hypothetical protein